jgi:hypothetical protein
MTFNNGTKHLTAEIKKTVTKDSKILKDHKEVRDHVGPLEGSIYVSRHTITLFEISDDDQSTHVVEMSREKGEALGSVLFENFERSHTQMSNYMNVTKGLVNETVFKNNLTIADITKTYVISLNDGTLFDKEVKSLTETEKDKNSTKMTESALEETVTVDGVETVVKSINKTTETSFFDQRYSANSIKLQIESETDTLLKSRKVSNDESIEQSFMNTSDSYKLYFDNSMKKENRYLKKMVTFDHLNKKVNSSLERIYQDKCDSTHSCEYLTKTTLNEDHESGKKVNELVTLRELS